LRLYATTAPLNIPCADTHRASTSPGGAAEEFSAIGPHSPDARAFRHFCHNFSEDLKMWRRFRASGRRAAGPGGGGANGPGSRWALPANGFRAAPEGGGTGRVFPVDLPGEVGTLSLRTCSLPIANEPGSKAAADARKRGPLGKEADVLIRIVHSIPRTVSPGSRACGQHGSRQDGRRSPPWLGGRNRLVPSFFLFARIGRRGCAAHSRDGASQTSVSRSCPPGPGTARDKRPRMIGVGGTARQRRPRKRRRRELKSCSDRAPPWPRSEVMARRDAFGHTSGGPPHG
jgi:hypothetical protein